MQRLIGCKTTKRHFQIFNGLVLFQFTFTTALFLFFWIPKFSKKLCTDTVLETFSLRKVLACDVTKGADLSQK